MKQLEGKNLTLAINNIHKAHNPEHIQEVLVSVIYSVFHGNTDPLNKMIGSANLVSNIPAPIRGYLGKQLKGCINKQKDKSYRLNAEGVRKALVTLDLDFQPAFEDVAELLPFWKVDKQKEKQAFDALGSAKRLLAKAQKAQEAGEFQGEPVMLARLIDALKPFDV